MRTCVGMQTSPETCQPEQITYLIITTLNMSPGRARRSTQTQLQVDQLAQIAKRAHKRTWEYWHTTCNLKQKWVLQKTQLTDTSNHRYNRIDSCKVQTIPIHKVMVVKRTITEVNGSMKIRKKLIHPERTPWTSWHTEPTEQQETNLEQWLKTAKRTHWEDFLQSVDDKDFLDCTSICIRSPNQWGKAQETHA